jgi:TPR repeat protein
LGFFPAQKELGSAYLNGYYKIPKDEEQGRLWLKRSEESKEALVNVLFKESLSK